METAKTESGIAEQPAEPVAQVVAIGQYEFPGLEWISADHSFRAPIGTKLYAIPDPRIAALEGLLIELNECGAINNWLRVSDDLRKRICAAIGRNDG